MIDREREVTHRPHTYVVDAVDLLNGESAFDLADTHVRIKLMSELDGDTLRTSHVVYIGYLSGLGMFSAVHPSEWAMNGNGG